MALLRYVFSRECLKEIPSHTLPRKVPESRQDCGDAAGLWCVGWTACGALVFRVFLFVLIG